MIFSDFLMFYQTSPSTQVKQCATITYKKWYVRVALRVAERLKTEDLRKFENIRKESKRH